MTELLHIGDDVYHSAFRGDTPPLFEALYDLHNFLVNGIRPESVSDTLLTSSEVISISTATIYSELTDIVNSYSYSLSLPESSLSISDLISDIKSSQEVLTLPTLTTHLGFLENIIRIYKVLSNINKVSSTVIASQGKSPEEIYTLLGQDLTTSNWLSLLFSDPVDLSTNLAEQLEDKANALPVSDLLFSESDNIASQLRVYQLTTTPELILIGAESVTKSLDFNLIYLINEYLSLQENYLSSPTIENVEYFNTEVLFPTSDQYTDTLSLVNEVYSNIKVTSQRVPPQNPSRKTRVATNCTSIKKNLNTLVYLRNMKEIAGNFTKETASLEQTSEVTTSAFSDYTSTRENIDLMISDGTATEGDFNTLSLSLDQTLLLTREVDRSYLTLSESLTNQKKSIVDVEIESRKAGDMNNSLSSSINNSTYKVNEAISNAELKTSSLYLRSTALMSSVNTFSSSIKTLKGLPDLANDSLREKLEVVSSTLQSLLSNATSYTCEIKETACLLEDAKKVYEKIQSLQQSSFNLETKLTSLREGVTDKIDSISDELLSRFSQTNRDYLKSYLVAKAKANRDSILSYFDETERDEKLINFNSAVLSSADEFLDTLETSLFSNLKETVVTEIESIKDNVFTSISNITDTDNVACSSKLPSRGTGLPSLPAVRTGLKVTKLGVNNSRRTEGC